MSASFFCTGLASFATPIKFLLSSKIPISVAHKEGHVDFSETGNIDKVSIALQFIDNYGNPTEKYPLNPNGSSKGLTGFTTFDGRSTVMMPHPERMVDNLISNTDGVNLFSSSLK